jgi:hypothetical protein
VACSSPGKTAFKVSGRIAARWKVRLSIARLGGWRSWLAVSGDFERGLEALASKTVITPNVDAETRRGRDYVRVTLAMTIVAVDVAEALDSARRAFQQASPGDVRDWDMTSAAAEVLPERNVPGTGITTGHVQVHESSPSDDDNASPRHRLSRGTIQRGIKMIKRQMFGRASLPLLLLD